MSEVVRLLLAAVLAVAGAAKLADREGSRRAMRAFGAPGWLAPALAVAELVLAVMLVPSATARAAALAAAALFVVFAGAIANALLRGRKLDCGCFGRLYSKPAGWGTMARNVGLALVALAGASQPAGTVSWIEVAVAATVMVVTGQAILAFVLLRRYGRALERIEELETATEEPPFVSPVPASGNGSARVALAGAAAGAVAVTAAVAQAAPPTDPELKAIDDVLREAGPKLVSAATRSQKAIRAQATVLTGKTARARRVAARKALAAERKQVLALRARVDRLPETTTNAHNAKMTVNTSLTLFAESLQKQEQAIGASPKAVRRLIKEGEKLLLRSIASSLAAGTLLGRGS